MEKMSRWGGVSKMRREVVVGLIRWAGGGVDKQLVQ